MARSLSEILRLPVRTAGIRLAQCVDAFVDDRCRLVGFEVIGRDGAHRFLPLAAAELGDEGIDVRSALVFMDERALAYYREHARSVRAIGLRDAGLEEDATVSAARSAA